MSSELPMATVPQPPTLKSGDLILLAAVRTNTVGFEKIICLITRVTPSGVYTWEPKFSLEPQPGTWTLSGPECYYTPISNTVFYPPGEDEPMPPGEILIINPTGPEMAKRFWGRCPYNNCSNHMFCPGCGGVSMDFPDLFMECGIKLSCPSCMGHQFAYEDKLALKRLDWGDLEDSEMERIRQERCDRIDARRAELGYSRLTWMD